MKISEAFKRYTRSYRIEIVYLKDQLVKDLFKDLLDENKGFKYQIPVKVLLRNLKENGDMICCHLF